VSWMAIVLGGSWPRWKLS